MKHIITLLISISFLFPYTALSYSYNIKNLRIEAENIQNTENPQAQLVGVTGLLSLILAGTIITEWFALLVLADGHIDEIHNKETLSQREKLINTCNEVHDYLEEDIEHCKRQVNQMDRNDLKKIVEIIESLQKLPPSMREEILIKAQMETIPIGV